jgi:deoxyribodipyrimidine photo-lyase
MEQTPLNITADTLDLVASNFAGLYSGALGLSSIKGGQTAANDALEKLDISGYAANRSEVLPIHKRGASVLSPYIRHNLLTLDQVYRTVKDAPFKDKEKFRDELYWQEYARHLYARLGSDLFQNLRFDANWKTEGDGWNRDMRCIDEVVSELEGDGWLVNQTRMWLASHWTVRNDKGWLHGQERMHRELIDGSRAANLLGWQWTVGAGTGKPYGFAKWQVDKRAPGICTKCPLRSNCPIENFPDEINPRQLERSPLLENDPDPARTAGPLQPIKLRTANLVLLTIDSLGDADGALAANPDLPVVFVFNKPALAKLQLSSRRIGFYIEVLKDLSLRRDVQVYLGDPYQFVQDHDVAVTYAPVPSFRKFKKLAEVHPYPWLKTPHAGTVKSFTSWRQRIDKDYKKS